MKIRNTDSTQLSYSSADDVQSASLTIGPNALQRVNKSMKCLLMVNICIENNSYKQYVTELGSRHDQTASGSLGQIVCVTHQLHMPTNSWIVKRAFQVTD